jgi:hypothetical protein
VHYRTRLIRTLLLLLAGLLAAAAIFIKDWRLLPFHDQYVVAGSFSSSLLPNVVSPYDIEAAVASVQFQGAVGAEVSAESVPDNPQAFRLLVRHAVQSEAEESFPEAVELLKIKLKSLAVSEVTNSRAYLDELRNQESERKDAKSPVAPAQRSENALSEDDARRAILLRKEIQDLKGFFNNGQAAAWLRAEIQRDSVTRAEKKIRDAKSELARLSEVFQAGSGPVKAQSEVLRKAEAEKLQLERHISKVLLDSHRAELKRLETKSEAIIKQNAKSVANSEPEPAPESTGEAEQGASRWLSEHSEKLNRKAERLERQAKLTALDTPTTSNEKPVGYWVCMGLWLGALSSLLGALFINSGPRRERRVAQQGRPRPMPPTPSRPAASLGVDSREGMGPDASEVFFRALRQNLEHTLGRSPGRILVLGNGEGERSALTLRLAKNFAGSGLKVRLVDFDLVGRSLSRRIGDESSPGVGDLLAHAGQASEFFASVPGTSIEFAPAGTLRVLGETVCQSTLRSLLRQPNAGVTLVDVGFTSPLHLLVSQIDVVLCMTRSGNSWSPQEEQVLLALKEAKLPILGVSQGGSQVFPFL